MQFIKLTGSTAGKAIMVPKDRVMSIAQGEDSTEVFVDGMSQVYTILPWHVKETPEEIIRLLEGETDAPSQEGYQEGFYRRQALREMAEIRAKLAMAYADPMAYEWTEYVIKFLESQPD